MENFRFAKQSASWVALALIAWLSPGLAQEEAAAPPSEPALPAADTAPEFYFNQRSVPESLDDIRAIEKALKAARQQVMDAVVCIEVGGGSGSGVIVNENGLILTAAHVTGGVGKELVIKMPNGTEHKAKSLGLRSDFDAAMAQIEGDGPFPYVDIEKAIPALGEWVFSLGHSGGFDLERGMVTRIARVVRKQEHTIQTDGTLIGGDSGGPVFNMHGQLVGIHSRVSRSLEQNMSVTIPMFTESWDEMLASEFLGEGPFAQKIPGFLGVRVEAEEDGLRVTAIGPDTPAQKAGLQEGDLLTRWNGEALESPEDLTEKIAQSSAGAMVTLGLKRGENQLELPVTLEEKFPS